MIHYCHHDWSYTPSHHEGALEPLAGDWFVPRSDCWFAPFLQMWIFHYGSGRKLKAHSKPIFLYILVYSIGRAGSVFRLPSPARGHHLPLLLHLSSSP